MSDAEYICRLADQRRGVAAAYSGALDSRRASSTALIVVLVLGLVNTLLTSVADPVDAAGNAADAGAVHLRHQRAAVPDGRPLGRRLYRRRRSALFGSLLYSIVSWLLSALILGKKEEPRTFHRVFPPQTLEGMEKLRAAPATPSRLLLLHFTAPAARRDRTLKPCWKCRPKAHVAAPHLSCIGSTRENIRAMLGQYRAAGIRRIVALRGDLPSGMAEARNSAMPTNWSNSSVPRPAPGFRIEVAAYPEWHPQAKSARRSPELQAQGSMPAPIRRSPNILQRRRLLAFCRRPRSAFRFPSCRASCRSPASRSWRGFPDACGAEIPRWVRSKWRATATIAPRSAPSAWTSSPNCARG